MATPLLRKATRLTLLLGLLLLAGCALSRPGVGGGMRDIQTDELQGATDDNLMDLIERIRPSWLHFHDLCPPVPGNEYHPDPGGSNTAGAGYL